MTPLVTEKAECRKQYENCEMMNIKKDKTTTNRNGYQPHVFCPADDIEARLALLGVSHTKR